MESQPIRAYRRSRIETGPLGIAGHWALAIYDGPQLYGGTRCSGLGTGIGGGIQSLTRRVRQQRVKESNPQVLPWPGLRNRFAATALPSIGVPPEPPRKRGHDGPMGVQSGYGESNPGPLLGRHLFYH